jgi:hypothetical protein
VIIGAQRATYERLNTLKKALRETSAINFSTAICTAHVGRASTLASGGG